MGIDNGDSDKFKIGYSATIGGNDVLTMTVGGLSGFGVAVPIAKLHVFQADNAAAIPALEIAQIDQSEGLINFAGNLAASAVGPISTWGSGNTIQGFYRVEINGTPFWAPYYDAPTGP